MGRPGLGPQEDPPPRGSSGRYDDPALRSRTLPTALVAAVLALGPGGADADPPVTLEGELEVSILSATGAARGIVLDDRAVVLAEIDAAVNIGPATMPIAKYLDRLADARTVAADPAASPMAAALGLQRAAKAAYASRRALPWTAWTLVIPAGGFGKPGGTLHARILGPLPGTVATFVVNDGPGQAVVEDVVVPAGRRIPVRFGPDAGSATLTVASAAGTRTLRLFNFGALPTAPGWGSAGAAPTALDYPSATVLARAGVAVDLAPSVIGGLPAEFLFTVDPALPAGVALDPATGAITGTPAAESPAATYTVSVANLHGSASFPLDLEVSPALPAGMISLEPGFAAERWLDGLSVPDKMAFAPDGRLFFNELATGNIRVVSAAGALAAAPFATVAVQTGGERGLLGLAFSPDFATSGHLFVYAIVPAAGPKPVRGQVIRFTASGNTGANPVVVVDDLPAADLLNGGDLQFGPDGKMVLSIGDNNDPANAQSAVSLAGKVLRYNADGTVPADNPYPGSPEFCRGLRNTFDLAFHAGTGGLFGSENGPTFGDEVNYLLPGRNYSWPSLPPAFPPNLIGPRVAQWTPVIVPTGIAFHSGAGFGAGYADNLFLCSYDRVEVRRLLLSGALLTNLDVQLGFAAFEDLGVDNKPLDIVEGPGGDLFVSTFTSIWRIDRYGARNP